MDDASSVSKMLGLLPLHLACIGGDNEEVIKIIASGRSDPNFDINMSVIAIRSRPSHEKSWPRQETALMLGTMMGHMSTVELLLSYGARVSQEDSLGYTARNFYAVGAACLEHRTFYLEKGIGQEHYDAANSKIAIIHLLARGAFPRMAPLVISKEGRRLTVRQVVDSIDTGRYITKQKTVGCLSLASEPKILFWASSGFRSKPASADDNFVNGKMLSSIALHKIQHLFPRRLGFKFKKSCFDNGGKTSLPEHAGRANSSHAEVQLATEYVLQLAEEICSDVTIALKDKLRYLRDANIGIAKRSATISLNSIPCRSCQLYLAALGTCTGVIFHVDSNVGVAQIHRKKDRHGNLQDVLHELWYDDNYNEQEDIQNYECQDGFDGNNITPNLIVQDHQVQGSTHQVSMKHQQQGPAQPPAHEDRFLQRVLESKIIDSIENDSDSYDSDRTMMEASILNKRSSRPRYISQKQTDDQSRDGPPNDSSEMNGNNFSLVVGRSPSNPFLLSQDQIRDCSQTQPENYVRCSRSVLRDTSASVFQTPSRILNESHFFAVSSDDKLEDCTDNSDNDNLFVSPERNLNYASSQRTQRSRFLECQISKKGPAARHQKRHNRPSSTDSYIPIHQRVPRLPSVPEPNSSPQIAYNSSIPPSQRSMSISRSVSASFRRRRRRRLQSKTRLGKTTTKKSFKQARSRATRKTTRGDDPDIAPPTKTFGGTLDAFRFTK